jgi:hypothetical protein
MAIPQIDQRLLATIPAKARLKAQRLVAAAIDAETAFMAVISRADRLREELGDARLAQRQAIERAKAHTDRPEEHEAAAAEYAPVIAELQGELARLDGERARREQRRYDSAQLVAQVRSWLETVSAGNAHLVMVAPPPPRLRDGEGLIEAINRMRAEINAARQELLALQRAPLPTGEMRERAKAFVDELAAVGRPMLRTASGTFAIEWHPGVHGGPLAPASVAIMAAMFPERLTELIEAEIAKINGSGFGSRERPGRQLAIEDRIVALERSEELLIEQAQDNGHDVGRRPQASPLAVLGVKYGLAQARAS